MYRIRFIWVMFICLLQKPVALLTEFKLSFFAVPLIDTDFTRLFTQTYGALMGLGRWHLLFHSEFRNVALKKGWVPVTTSEKINYKKSIRAFDRITMTTKLLYWDDRRFYLEQIFTVKGQVCTRALVEGMVRGPQGHLSPIQVFKEIGVTQQSPALTEEIKNYMLI